MIRYSHSVKTIFKNNYFRLVVAIFLLLSAYFINISRVFERSEEAKINQFISELHSKETQIEKEISILAKKSSQQKYETLFQNENEYYNSLFENEGFLFYIYENDTLKFWTNNFAPVNFTVDSTEFQSRILHLKNGWYGVFKKNQNTQMLVGFLLLKTDYPIENKYLSNYFQKDFLLNENAEIILTAPSEGVQRDEVGWLVKSSDRVELFNIKFSRQEPLPHPVRLLITLLNIFGFIFLIGFLKSETKSFSAQIGNNKTIFLFIISVTALRVIALLLQYPQAFYEMPLFSPEHYATSFLFPSLGDFIINALLIFYISYYVRIHISLDFLNEMKRVKKRRLYYFLLILLFAFAVMCEYLIKGLIENSNISFNVNNLLELNGFSYAAIASIGLLLFAFFFVCDLVVFIFYSENFLLREIIPVLVISSFPFIVLLVWFDYGTLPLLWSLLVFSLLFFIYKSKNGEYGFTNIVIVISVFSLLAANSLLKHISQKELTHRKVLAEKLALEEDPVAEHLYSEIESKLINDVIFSNLKYGLVNYDKEFFDNALKEKYFSGYLSRYDVKSYLYKTDGSSVSPFNKIKRERSYFERLITQSGRPTLNENMLHIENSEENENYIIKLLVKDRAGKEITGVLYIALISKLQPEITGFPELLLDKNVKNMRSIADKKYSFARYRNGKLSEHFGKFNYSLVAENYGNRDKKISFSEIENYDHLTFRSDRQNAIVLSKKGDGLAENITTFSYLFALFGILVLLFLNLRNFPKNFKMKNSSFNYKVQVMVVGIIFTSLILFGMGTSYYIYREYDEKNHNLLSEKIHSILIEVEQKLGEEEQLDEKMKEYISYILTKFSTVFFTDINLYDLDGTLLASSRPKLFNDGIISKKMEPKAFSEMKFLQKSEFIQDEKIGGLDYHSAYIAFKNKNGELLAFLNLPYFARQDTLQDEISSFLVTLINIYVFLFAISLMAALFISSAITRPLQYVQAMLSRVELGKINKPIEYRGKDEIGQLVKVYNSKVAELEKSAELLAKSERESAWREMAKQVAHEIKNPLTPMKLSVQHLQRALKEEGKNTGEILKKFTQTMIEQIDALSAIASEFSNFAKMPKANNEVINLISVVENSLHLFKETPNVKFEFSSETNQALVYADKEQLTRIFINLIQNSIQAIPQEREGIVKISILSDDRRQTTHETSVVVSISDNGMGIHPEQAAQIFSPNFTTKTAGMGLGLAMVKSIVESANGKIRFETQLEKGTVFFVQIPVWKENL